MRRLVVDSVPDDMDFSKVTFKVEEVPVERPASGEVLVKVLAAPVNPSDYGEWRSEKAKGSPIGKEGSGIVVASGGGFMANRLLGKRVGIVAGTIPGRGTYQEYVCVPAMKGVFPLPDDVPTEDACSFFVNPFTAAGFIDTVRARDGTGFVHTAAASQLGQMLVKLCKQEKLTLINVVRREEQAELLRGLGAEHIVVSSKDGWMEELKEKIQATRVNIAFDAIAGDSTGHMLECLPKGGTCFVYGGLSKQGCSSVNPLALIYERKKLEGWLLPTWLLGEGTINMIKRSRWASALVLPALKDGWSATQFTDCTLDTMQDEFRVLWASGFTGKKLRLRMDQQQTQQ